MIKRRGQSFAAWLCMCDMLAVGIAWVGAYHLRFSGLIPVTKEQPPPEWCYDDIPLITLLGVIAFWLARNYEISRLRRLREELWAVLKAIPLLVLLATGAAFFQQDPYVSRAAILLFAGLAFGTVMIGRRTSWWLVHYLRKRGYNPTFAIIVGTGRVARKTAAALRKASWMGIRNVGYIEDNPTRWCSDLDILGTVADLPKLVEKYNVEHVFIALPMNRYHESRRVFDVLSQTLVEVRMVADIPALAGLSLTTTYLEGMPIVGLRESPHYGANIVIKRMMDIVLGVFAVVLLAPVLVVVALAVKLTSRGPIFHRQIRCGLNGKQFMMLKFRSMHVNAEANGPTMAVKGDKRYTPIGGFLRKTSLDELPQFFNVIWGQMSIVGPRPERPEFIEKFQQTIPNYMARHAVKCGITGWAQVNGWRGNTSLRKRLQYDLYYIVHWNPWFDLKIMFLTAWNAFFKPDGY